MGIVSGSLTYRGQPLAEMPAESSVGDIGMVFQNPDAQIVMDTVWHELAFSMENMGYPPAVMRGRLAEISGLFGLEPLLYKPVHELSGGQKQLLNLASVLLLQPKVLLLDEPTSQLDPVAAREFLQTLHRLNQEMSLTVIISEHRLEDVLPLADRVLLLEDGRLQAEGTPREFARIVQSGPEPAYMEYLPAASRLYLTLSPATDSSKSNTVPLTVREGKRWMHTQKQGESQVPSLAAAASSREQRPVSEPLLSCREVTFRYEKEGPEILKKLSLSLNQGELLAIMGGNGAGKSTLLHLLSGLYKPQRGKITLAQGVTTGFLAQNPLLYFSYDTAGEELYHMAQYAGMPQETAEREIAQLVEIFQLRDVLESHPHDISGGQQQKLALAMVLLLKPDILLLDEPTKGLDPGAKHRLARELQHLREQGVSLIIVTHDVEFAAKHASRCAMLFDGSITAEGDPAEFFSNNYFYTTAVNRIVRELLPQALTMEDVIKAWSGFVYRS